MCSLSFIFFLFSSSLCFHILPLHYSFWSVQRGFVVVSVESWAFNFLEMRPNYTPKWKDESLTERCILSFDRHPHGATVGIFGEIVNMCEYNDPHNTYMLSLVFNVHSPFKNIVVFFSFAALLNELHQKLSFTRYVRQDKCNGFRHIHIIKILLNKYQFRLQNIFRQNVISVISHRLQWMLLNNRIQASQKSFNSNTIYSLPDFEQIRTHCFELFCNETIHFPLVFAFRSRIYSILSSIYFSKVFYFLGKKSTNRIQTSLLCLWKISTRLIFFVFYGIAVVEIIQFHFQHFLQICYKQTSENRQSVESVLVVWVISLVNLNWNIGKTIWNTIR